jgi:thiamine-phosphate pyrophosphorylase
MGIRIPRLYAIIDSAQVGEASLVAVCDSLLSAGVKIIQFRDKLASPRQLFESGGELLKRVRHARGVFILNDRPDIARVLDADGVHVGQEDVPVHLVRKVVGAGKWVGCSTHNLRQLSEADQSSADYLAIGPIFDTASKEHPSPTVGLDGLRAARAATDKPLVAIGGITLENAPEVIDSGADSLAVIGDLLHARDIAARARQFLKVLGEAAA